MRTLLIAAAVSAAMLAPPFAEAGFSTKSTSSSSKSSSYSYRSSGSSSTKSSSFGGSYSKPSSSYSKPPSSYSTPAAGNSSRALGSPRLSKPTPSLPKPVGSGFSSSSQSSKPKTTAKVAAATALGASLYAAGANQAAIEAYQAQADAKPAEQVKPQEAKVATAAVPTPAPVVRQAEQPRTQVIVVQQPSHYDHRPDDSAYWYERGRRAAQRDATAQTQPVPQVAPQVAGQSVRSVAPANQARDTGWGTGTVVLVLLAFALLIGFAYFLMATSASNAVKKAKNSTPNYTL